MSKKVEIENNKETKIRLKIKLFNNDIFKETYIESRDNIKMKTFFNVDYKKISNEISSDEYSIYFLIDENKNSIYIGKSRNFLSRLQLHYKNPNKNFNKIIQLFSEKWTPTIIDYLEYWFIDFFYKNKILEFNNNKLERKPNYTSSDEEHIDYALDTLKWLLLTEGINISYNENKINKIIKNSSLNNQTTANKNNEYKVYFKNVEAIYCKYEKSNRKIKLLKDTKLIWEQFDIKKFPKCKNSIDRYNKWFEENIKLGNITKISSKEFKLNIDLNMSPSLSAVLIVGYFAQNGKTAWKTIDGNSIKELENE